MGVICVYTKDFIRADALRRLAESDDPRAQKVFDQTLRRP